MIQEKLATQFSLSDAISLREAAKIAGKSVSWVRDCREYGPLVPAELNGRQAVSKASLLRLLAKRQEKKAAANRKHFRRPELVVDNTRKE